MKVARLRHRQDAPRRQRARDERRRDPGGDGLRDAALHVARAGAGQAARRAERPLLARRHPLSHAHGPAAVHRRRRNRRHGAAHQDAPAAAERGRSRSANIPPELEEVVMRVLAKEAATKRPERAEASRATSSPAPSSVGIAATSGVPRRHHRSARPSRVARAADALTLPAPPTAAAPLADREPHRESRPPRLGRARGSSSRDLAGLAVDRCAGRRCVASRRRQRAGGEPVRDGCVHAPVPSARPSTTVPARPRRRARRGSADDHRRTGEHEPPGDCRGGSPAATEPLNATRRLVAIAHSRYERRTEAHASPASTYAAKAPEQHGRAASATAPTRRASTTEVGNGGSCQPSQLLEKTNKW